MIKLKDYETIKSPLLKEWSEKNFEHYEKSAENCAKHNLNNYIIYEAGSSLPAYQNLVFLDFERVEELFGFPYTSSGDFAAIWNTNTQARAKYGAPLYFKGVTRAENGQNVLLFNKGNKTYYFYDFEFASYQEHERIKQAAKDWGEFVKACNKTKDFVIKTLCAYVGRQYGEKTKAAIYDTIKAKADALGVSVWLFVDTYSQRLEIRDKKYDNFYKSFYFDFLTTTNTIQEPNTSKGGRSVENLEEFDSIKEFEQMNKTAQKLQKMAAAILETMGEYNKHADRINQRPKATESTYAADLERMARGDL